jgi:hypothetical protein
MKTASFSEEIFADSLGEAIDKARALTRNRPEHANEDMVQLLDEAQPEQQVVWTRSVEEIRA